MTRKNILHFTLIFIDFNFIHTSIFLKYNIVIIHSCLEDDEILYRTWGILVQSNH